MLASYATIVRRAALVTAAVAAVAVAVSGGVMGTRGLTGALAGVALVTFFFGISILVVGRAAKVGPGAMMAAALGTYLVKFVALAFVLSAVKATPEFSTRALGLTAVACILAWSAGQVITAMKVKTLYVEPKR